MKISEKGIALIKKYEGLRLTSYRCPAGIWTIGWGHTRTARPNQSITASEADQLLRSDLKQFENGVKAFVKVPLNQNQFDALVSLSFNIGITAFSRSTLLMLLNEGNYSKASNQFDRWVKANGITLPGLVTRRAEEKELFLLPVEESMSNANTKRIEALTETFLKKLPRQASELLDSEKVFVPIRKAYLVEKVLDTYRLHTKVRLSHNAGDWWLFNPHWNLNQLSQERLLKAIFSIRPQPSESLLVGDLKFYLGSDLDMSFKATSGARRFQYRGAESIRGRGLIPEDTIWKINPNGWWSNTAGIEGMFYPITPDPYKKGLITRAELGVHRDANIPGSAGCIVLLDSDDFNRRFVPYMARQVREYGKSLIPLEVKYL